MCIRSNPSLFFLSGLPPAEKPAAKKYYLMSYGKSSTHQNGFTNAEPENDIWKNYKDYLARTSIVIPVPPSFYKTLPEWLKRSVLLDFPMFRFNESTEGKAALEEQREDA